MTPSSRSLGPLAAVGGSVILWSSAYAVSGFVLESGSPAVLAVGRFALALVVLLPFAARRPGLRRALRQPSTIVLGFTGITVYYVLTNIGMLFTTAGVAALVSALLPVLTALFGRAMLGERIPAPAIVGLVLATAGVGVASTAGLSLDAGLLLCTGGIVAYALYTVMLRRIGTREDPLARIDPLSLATATSIWGTVLLMPWLGLEVAEGTARLPEGTAGILALLFLGIVVSAPTMVLFNYGAERLPAATSGVLTAGIPALGYAVAVLSGEEFSALRALGGAVALVGIVVATAVSPAVEPSPPGSALPAPADTAPIAIIPAIDVAPPSPLPVSRGLADELEPAAPLPGAQELLDVLTPTGAIPTPRELIDTIAATGVIPILRPSEPQGADAPPAEDADHPANE